MTLFKKRDLIIGPIALIVIIPAIIWINNPAEVKARLISLDSDRISRSFSSGEPEVGAAAPEIVGTDLSGTEIKLSDYRGKVVMVNFWRDT